VNAGSQAGTSRAIPRLHLRPAPDVVRSWRPFDGLLYNSMTMNVVVMFSLPLLTALAFYPTGNLPLAIVVAGAFCTIEAVVYAFLASTFPRNGGDYFFQSRLLSGAVGTVFAFTAVVLGGAMWMAIAGWFACNMAVGPFVLLLGRRLESELLISFGHWLLSDHGLMALALAVTAWSAVVNVWGMRAYARLQRAFWAVGAVCMLALFVMALTTTFAIDATSAEATIAEARRLGFGAETTGAALATVALIPVAAFPLIYPAWSVQQGGEIRRAHELRVQVLMIVGAEIVTVAVALMTLSMVMKQLGADYLGASAYLFFHSPGSLPGDVVPFVGILHVSGWLGGVPLVFMAILFNAWFWMWAPDITLAASRVLLAMSSDRLLPHWLGYLDVRAKAPVRAIAFFSALCVGAALMYAYSGFWRLTLDAALLNVAAFAVTCGAAAAFPWTKRELYRESTAAAYEVLGVPLITVLGAVFVAFTCLLAWRFLVDDALALGADLVVSLSFVAALYAFSLALYFGFHRYRRAREGVEVEIFYREMPVD
jgi:amino acid transporter